MLANSLKTEHYLFSSSHSFFFFFSGLSKPQNPLFYFLLFALAGKDSSFSDINLPLFSSLFLSYWTMLFFLFFFSILFLFVMAVNEIPHQNPIPNVHILIFVHSYLHKGFQFITLYRTPIFFYQQLMPRAWIFLMQDPYRIYIPYYH